jgi:hypothetical protein
MAGKTFSDDPDYYECRDLNNNPSQLFHRPEDFHQAIRFIEAHYLKSQIDRQFNDAKCMIPEQCSYTSGWTMYNQIYTMDHQLPKLREAPISTPKVKGLSSFETWYIVRGPSFANAHILTTWSMDQPEP